MYMYYLCARADVLWFKVLLPCVGPSVGAYTLILEES